MFAAIMLLLAGMAIAFGMIRQNEAGRLNLGPWLVLEMVGGAIASFLAGAVSRRVSRNHLGPAVLALCVFTVGLLEATEILHHTAAGRVEAPGWLVLLAPFATAVSVWLGGWVTGTQSLRCLEGTRLTVAWRYCLPVTVLAAAAALSLFVLPGLAVGAESAVVASALALDFTVVVPGLVFLLLVRARRAPLLVIIPTFVVGYAIAMATIPSQHQATLEFIRLLVIPAELCIVVYFVVMTRRALVGAASGDGDFATRLRAGAREVLASRFPADILTTEIAILYYACRWSRPSPQTPGSYTVYRGAGYGTVVIGLIIVLFVETVPLHILVRLWSSVAAWILTILSIYACVWLVGDYRAMAARPLRITTTHLLLRVGIRWEADIPRERIERVDLRFPHNELPKSDTLVATLLGQANMRLRLNAPILVIGMYGIQRTVQEIWLSVDGAAELHKVLCGLDAS